MKYLPVLWITSGLILFAWVAIDCGATGHNWLFWGIVVIFFNVLGLLFYFLVTRTNIGPRPERRDLVLRDKDNELRHKYSQMKSASLYDGGLQSKTAGPGAANPDFTDPRLEGLIEMGKTREAREYIEEMKEIAREVNDKTMLANLKKYETRVVMQSGMSGKDTGQRF